MPESEKPVTGMRGDSMKFCIDESKFTKEQSASFDRLIDCLARLTEKYAPMIDTLVPKDIREKKLQKKQSA